MKYIVLVKTNDVFFDDAFKTDEIYETLEMQLTQIPKINSPHIKKAKFLHSSIQEKSRNSGKNKFKSIIEPRKFFQPYRIIGGEGEETSKFKHPLGKLIMKYPIYYLIIFIDFLLTFLLILIIILLLE